MVLLAGKGFRTRIDRHVGHTGHAGGEDQLRGLERHRFAVAQHLDRPAALGFVEAGLHAFGFRPVVQLHDLGVHLQPVTDLVFRREDRPVLREGQVGHVVVPDRVMQAQRLVATAPLVAGALGLVDDQCRHAEALESCAKAEAALATADHQAVGLFGDAQRGFLVAALFQPVALVGQAMAVFGAQWATASERFLVALQLAHGGQQRPAQAVLQTHITLAAGDVGFQADPAFEHAVGQACFAFEHAVGQACFAFELPVVRPGGFQAAFQHVANVGLAFEGDQVPAEQHQVTPVAVVGEQLKRAIDVALRQALAEAFDPGGQLFGG